MDLKKFKKLIIRIYPWNLKGTKNYTGVQKSRGSSFQSKFFVPIDGFSPLKNKSVENISTNEELILMDAAIKCSDMIKKEQDINKLLEWIECSLEIEEGIFKYIHFE